MKASWATFQLHGMICATCAVFTRFSYAVILKWSGNTEVLLQRLAVGVHVDEDVAPPRADLAWGRHIFVLSRCWKSHSDGRSFRSPSRLHVSPWNGHRNSGTRPSRPRSRRPRCRQVFCRALMDPSLARVIRNESSTMS